MAKSNPALIEALRETANRLSNGGKYEWGHMGRCNCGHLVQTITKMTDKEIAQEVNHRLDEWTEHANDYCENTGSSVDSIFDTMKEYGFDHEDMAKLEYLSDKKVLSRIGDGQRIYLRRNNIDDVVLYLEAMAGMLEDETLDVRY